MCEKEMRTQKVQLGIIILILHMRKFRHREIKLIQGYASLQGALG